MGVEAYVYRYETIDLSLRLGTHLNNKSEKKNLNMRKENILLHVPLDVNWHAACRGDAERPCPEQVTRQKRLTGRQARVKNHIAEEKGTG